MLKLYLGLLLATMNQSRDTLNRPLTSIYRPFQQMKPAELKSRLPMHLSILISPTVIRRKRLQQVFRMRERRISLSLLFLVVSSLRLHTSPRPSRNNLLSLPRRMMDSSQILSIRWIQHRPPRFSTSCLAVTGL